MVCSKIKARSEIRGGIQMEERLLEVKDLKVSFNVGKKKLTAVENVEFSLIRER